MLVQWIYGTFKGECRQECRVAFLLAVTGLRSARHQSRAQTRTTGYHGLLADVEAALAVWPLISGQEVCWACELWSWVEILWQVKMKVGNLGSWPGSYWVVLSLQYVLHMHVWSKCRALLLHFTWFSKLIFFFFGFVTAVGVSLANWFLFLWFCDSCGRRTRRGKALRIIRERISDDSCSTLRLTSRLPHLPPNLFSTPAPPPEPHPFSFCHGVSKNDSYGYARARTSAKTQQPKTHLPPSSFASSQPTSTAPAQPTPWPSWSHPPTHHALICNATLVACLKDQLMQGLVTLPA